VAAEFFAEAMFPFPIEKIYLDVKAERDWVSQTVLKALPQVPVEKIEDKRTLIKRFHGIFRSHRNREEKSSHHPILWEAFKTLSGDIQSHLLWISRRQYDHQLPNGLLLLRAPGVSQ